jgi:outer membrane biosynthesis protein TonB
MFINLNYSLSIILHILVVCCLIFVFKIEKQKNIYNDVININLKPLKTFKTEDISKENSFIDIKKDKESKKEINKNTETITKIKTPKKEVKKKIKTNNSVNKFQEQKEEKKNTENNDQLQKNQENSKSKIISQEPSPKKEKTNNTTTAVITNEEKEIFNNYNNELKAVIQKKATENYPRISLRKREEGIVELKFSIDMNGNIINVNTGKKTNAPERLINASINTLELISPYKKNPILKKNNTFSIIIVYKLE